MHVDMEDTDKIFVYKMASAIEVDQLAGDKPG